MLDEGQIAKSQYGKIHEAIRALPYVILLLISGTLIANRWWDLFGLFHLFPQAHAFGTYERFNKAFARIVHGKYKEPMLMLPGLVLEYYDFVVNEYGAYTSAGWAFHYIKALRMCGDMSPKAKKMNDDSARALAYAIRARWYIAGTIMRRVPTNALLIELINHGQIIGRTREGLAAVRTARFAVAETAKPEEERMVGLKPFLLIYSPLPTLRVTDFDQRVKRIFAKATGLAMLAMRDWWIEFATTPETNCNLSTTEAEGFFDDSRPPDSFAACCSPPRQSNQQRHGPGRQGLHQLPTNERRVHQFRVHAKDQR
ncbi:hypothetical protein K505DRAFT_334264 [Melanomma pulvis-pyrius CBS 109.77]|uniref:Uncharacterized protein n=1 Tax=Melanomma pulvis-pyrius CBS 109.77 TaxID=1314802 RepID=A0A6A6XMN1_9PLEO|nr:hypothetical protein K505DRAFT_334264 [Melanomma pulvis-pyrius CBS 109.77]